jgi:hypothetical protein
MPSEALEPKLALESVAEELHDGAAHDNLATVCRGTQTSCMMDCNAGVVTASPLDLSGVNRDPYPKLHAIGPGRTMQGPLQCCRGSNRGRRCREHYEVAIAFTARSHDFSAARQHRTLDRDIQNIQCGRHPPRDPQPMLRAALDVGQQQHQELFSVADWNWDLDGVHASRL